MSEDIKEEVEPIDQEEATAIVAEAVSVANFTYDFIRATVLAGGQPVVASVCFAAAILSAALHEETAKTGGLKPDEDWRVVARASAETAIAIVEQMAIERDAELAKQAAATPAAEEDKSVS